jgi:hypothetical protein
MTARLGTVPGCDRISRPRSRRGLSPIFSLFLCVVQCKDKGLSPHVGIPIAHCHHSMVYPQVADGEEFLHTRRVAAKILNKQSRAAKKGWSYSLEPERGMKTPHHYKTSVLRNATQELGRIISNALSNAKWIVRKHGATVWTRFIWLRIGIGGGLFRT